MHDFPAHFANWFAADFIAEQDFIDSMIEYRDKTFPDGNYPIQYMNLENKVGKNRAFYLQEDIRDGHPTMDVRWIWNDDFDTLQLMLADYRYEAPPKHSNMPRYIHNSIPKPVKKPKKEKDQAAVPDIDADYNDESF